MDTKNISQISDDQRDQPNLARIYSSVAFINTRHHEVTRFLPLCWVIYLKRKGFKVSILLDVQYKSGLSALAL